MKSLLTKIAIRKAVGLYLGEHEVAVSKVASTPLGPVEVASSSEPCTPEDLPEVIERLLVPLVGRKRRVPVAVGLASSRLFFGTRLTATSGAATPEAVLQKALCSSNISRRRSGRRSAAGQGEQAAGYERGRLPEEVHRRRRRDSQPVGRAAASHRAVALCPGAAGRTAVSGSAPVEDVVAGVSGRYPRAGGGGCRRPAAGLADIRLARRHRKASPFSPRPGHWRTQGRHYGIESSLDYAMVHGRADLHERLAERAIRHGHGNARDLARRAGAGWQSRRHSDWRLGCLTPNLKAFDLSRSLKSRPSIWEIFPWWDLGFTAILVAFMALVLGAHSMKLDETYGEVQAQNSQHKCLASADLAGLQREKKELEGKIDAVRKFLDSRILWSAYLRDISIRLPPNVVLELVGREGILGQRWAGRGEEGVFDAGDGPAGAGRRHAP